MKKNILALFFSLVIFDSFCQNKIELKEPSQLFTNTFYSKKYLKALDTLISQINSYDTSYQWRSIYYQMLGTAYSFIGNDLKARLFFDKMYGRNPAITSLNIDSLCLSYSKVFSAKEYILKKANTFKIIMINEAHHISQHRVFTYALLQDLYNKGFRYLAVEAYHTEDSLLVSRGYPSLNDKGFYIQEPIFGNLLREALRIGYTLVSYDDMIACSYDRNKINYCKNIRELNQAVNIYKILQRDPNAKILVHAGFGHILESTTSDWIKMAEFFKMISGIDPLTVNQTFLIEHADSNLGKEYNYIIRKYSFHEPSILLNSADEPFSFNLNGKIDMNIFWPKVIYNHHRPLYFNYIHFKKYTIPKKYIKKGYLIQAFNKSENKNPIPIDQVYIDEIEGLYDLRLPNGDYLIRISTKKNSSIDEFIIHIS